MANLHAVHSYSRILILLLVALALPVVPFLVIGELPGERWLSAADADAGLFALTGAGLLIMDILLPVPSSIVATLLGTRLGFIPGWLAAWAGLTLGNALGYWVGRLWPQRWAPEIPERPALITLILSRPVPILAEAMAIAAGASREPFRHVVLACLLGNGIYTGILAANGAALLADNLTGPGILLPLLLPVAGWLGWQAWRRRTQDNRLQADKVQTNKVQTNKVQTYKKPAE